MNDSASNILNINDYFFLIDSDNIKDVESNIYGYVISEDGIFDKDNVKNLNFAKVNGCGTYVIVKKEYDKVVISQDFSGNFGLYLYQTEGYFAISNSFYMLIEHVKTSKPISVNKAYAGQFLSTWITSLSYSMTGINEIERVPSHGIVTLGYDNTVKIDYIEYDYNSVAIDSAKGIKILDQWYERWIRIVKNIHNKTKQLCIDLSGGMDSRLTFLFFINSGIDLSKTYVRSLTDGLHTHNEDYEIANMIAEQYGFKLNQYSLINNEGFNFSKDDILNITRYVKEFFQKEYAFPTVLRKYKVFNFGGFGGETVRPYWDMPAKSLITREYGHLQGYKYGTAKSFIDAIDKVLEGTYDRLREKYHINDNESWKYSFNTFRECYSRNHFGKILIEALLCNSYKMSPMMDPLLQKVRLESDDCDDRNLLVAVIFDRYCRNILNIKFDSERKFNTETLKKAQKINKNFPFKGLPEIEINKDFDFAEKPLKINVTNNPVSRKEMENNYVAFFNTSTVKNNIEKYFGIEAYNYAKKFAETSSYYPLRHMYSVIAVSELIDAVLLNVKNLKGIEYLVDKKSIFGEYNCSNEALELTNIIRVDILGKDYRVVSVSDNNAYVKLPDWFQKEGIGYSIESKNGSLDIVIRGNKTETLDIKLRGLECVIDNNRIPKWVKVTKFILDNECIINESKLIWHDKPIEAKLQLQEEKYSHIHVEWEGSHEYI